jgi:hypothetical protein
VGAHPQQLFLRRAESLDARIDELIKHGGALNRDIAIEERRIEQSSDRSLDGRVDVALRVTQLALGLLETRTERGVSARQSVRVERIHSRGEAVVSLVRPRVDNRVGSPRAHGKGPSGRQRPKLSRR